KVPDRRIEKPHLAEGRVPDRLGNPRTKKSGDVGLRRELVEPGQPRELVASDRRLGIDVAFRGRRDGRVRRIGIVGAARRLLAPRPPREKPFLLLHDPAPRAAGRNGARASNSGSARSRARLRNGRSTWNAEQKA